MATVTSSPRGPGAVAAHQREHHLRRLEAAEQACGCREGEIAMVLGVAVVFGLLVGRVHPHTPGAVAGAALSLVAVLFAAGLVGKLVGLGAARLRVRYHRRKLRLEVPGPWVG